MMMEYGEKHNLLAEEQYEVNKRLIIDIARQTRTDAIYIANNAKSYYDRILLSVAYLTMRNFGIPEKVALSSVKNITLMEYFVRIVYGHSKTGY